MKGQPRNPTKVEFHSVDKDGATIACSIEYPHKEEEQVEEEVHTTTRYSQLKHSSVLEQLKRSDLVKAAKKNTTENFRNEKLPATSDTATNLDQSSQLTKHDRRLLADIHSSYSSLSKSSPLTSSWETFTKPALLSERGKEDGKSDPSYVELKQPPKASIDAKLPERMKPGYYDAASARGQAEGKRMLVSTN